MTRLLVNPLTTLIAIGGGLAVLVVHLVKKDAPAQASVVIGAGQHATEEP